MLNERQFKHPLIAPNKSIFNFFWQYFETCGVEFNFADLVSEEVRNRKEASTFMEKINGNIQRKIMEQRTPVGFAIEACGSILLRNSCEQTSTINPYLH